MDDLFKDLIDAAQFSKLQRQITQTEGEPETGQVYDWDSEAKYEDESYLTPERLAEVWKELHPGTEEDD